MSKIGIVWIVILVLVVGVLFWQLDKKASDSPLGGGPSGQVSTSSVVEIGTASTLLVAGNGTRNGLDLSNVGLDVIWCSPGTASATINSGLFFSTMSSSGVSFHSLNEATGRRWTQEIHCITDSATSVMSVWEY